ncbi:MAG: UDP-N-acetylmuramoyl-L-alanyl-D-glutamate--2,6-diaminopimelate ligase [Phycisphaerales bacterium]|jgi:UDP-N-acetylmuramoyl-L-alanyl-D-glutamate--2,6-diaminopimelate ligase|nr:UDP-N-acetylmuramoyl-L-alanyl-D-glutamate--2,6-diaminopimelate ligase [Phycisphaerales bacterium]
MLLHQLLRQLDYNESFASVPNIPITAIVDDSRRVIPGSLFIARPGTKTDGTKFVADAAARGAAVVLTQSHIDSCSLPQVLIKNTALAVPLLAHAFCDHPTRQVKVIGVTGTNGKTTTTYLIRHLLAKIGRHCGLIGTVQIDDGQKTTEAAMTTPGAIELAQLLATMRDNGCQTCAMEVSSHALHQQRTAGIGFAAAAFTNLTGDHLDYHKTMDAYADAKAMLFEGLDDQAVAVVNAEDSFTPRMIRDTSARIIHFGFTEKADYQARDIAVTAQGSHFVLVTPDGRANVQMQLIGRHNIENALTAAALVGETFGLSVHQIAAGLKDAQGAPGRLQAVRSGQPFAVLVDYAHTDDALENVLSALRPLSRGKLRILFGCGGDRDRTKRPRMARTAMKFADVIYITSDNPRTENPQGIIDEILTGLPADKSTSVVVEPDRRRAIELALNDAQEGDIILLAGKGHENYQIIGTEKRHFDDVEEATRILGQRFNIQV